jgi:hypothetical protein
MFTRCTHSYSRSKSHAERLLTHAKLVVVASRQKLPSGVRSSHAWSFDRTAIRPARWSPRATAELERQVMSTSILSNAM